MRSPRRDSAAGFTLLEVLVAVAILGVAVVAFIELSGQSIRLVKSSSDYQQAVLLADRIAMETQPTEEVVDSGQDGVFQWERRVTIVPMPDELQSKETTPDKQPLQMFGVTIDVRWGRNQSLQLATIRTPISAPNSASQGAAGTQTQTTTGTQAQTPGGIGNQSTTTPRSALTPAGSTGTR